MFSGRCRIRLDRLVEQSVEAGCAGGVPQRNPWHRGRHSYRMSVVGRKFPDMQEVLVFDLESRQIKTLSNQSGVRLPFQHLNRERRYVILRVSFALRQGGNASVGYAISNRSSRAGLRTDARRSREAVRNIRRFRKAMLIVPGDEGSHSVGSFFKNPTVPRQFSKTCPRARITRSTTASYPSAGGFRKSGSLAGGHAGFGKAIAKEE